MRESALRLEPEVIDSDADVADTQTVEIQMPQMGESVTEGTILEWHVSEGQEIAEGDTVVEISTDKIDAEVPAPASGVITRILANVDDTVAVGQALAEIDPNGSGNGAAPPGATDTGEGDADIGESDPAELLESAQGADDDPSASPAEAPAGETVVVAMPEMGESVTEGTVLEWRVAEGDQVNEGDTVIEVSTDKIDAEVPAPSAGTITKLLVQPDDVVKVGQPLAEMAAGEQAARSTEHAEPQAEASAAGVETPAVDGEGRASPVARRMAAERGVDLGSVEGSGPGGKVVKADVLAAEGNGAAPAAPARAGEAKPLRGPAAMLVKAMDESRTTPTATSFRTLPVDTLDAKRKAINAQLKERGIKLSFTHLIAWAIVRAATEWPVMVRTFEERDGKPFVITDSPVNLGIAVDVEKKDGSRGLMVPCIKGADALDFAGFHGAYEDLINKTRENKLTPDDFQGTNISLTNPGGLGTVASVPRLMTGQGAIIAVGSITYPVEWAHAPAEKIKALGISKVTTMTSTYDHRIIQGAESGSFLGRIDQLLQGEDSFYETVAHDLGVPDRVVAQAHPASASAPPLPVAGTTPAPAGAMVTAEPDRELLQAVQAATSLLKAFRTHGHLAATVNPLAESAPKGDPALEPESLNLTPELMQRIPASILRIGVEGETLLDALPRMREAYCGTIAYQIEHLSSHQQRMWLREMIETGGHRTPLTADEKRSLLRRLIDVFQFERFIQKAYLGQKMFSIEGLDAVVPMIDGLVSQAGAGGAEEVVIGMAHRGRLSVLVHNLGRSPESIMAEFEGAKALDRVKAIAAIPHSGTGDVKYHYGAEGVMTTPDGEEIRVRLYPNPSHLEYVDPVVTGGARAAQTEHSGPRLHHSPNVAVPLLLHGDAAFPGQGVVAETLNLQSLEGYSTGGTIHIITDNQVGFTTDPEEDRSTPYAGDLAKGFNCPIIHVNADDVEACMSAMRLAMSYRERFGRDVVHRPHRLPPLRPQRDRRARLHAAEDGRSDQGASAGLGDLRRAARQGGRGHAGRRRRRREGAPGAALPDAQGAAGEDGDPGDYEDPTSTHIGTGELDRTKSPEVETAVSEKRLRSLNEELLRVPDGFAIHRKLRKPLMTPARDPRRRVRSSTGHAEALAYASLLTEGTHIRLTGQDTERGHVLEPPPGAPRREDRAPLRADAEPERGARAVRDPQQPAVGDRLPGVRVRLLGGVAREPDPLGGAVRRLRQRGPGDHRQLHRGRGIEVGTDDATHPAAAPRIRGVGPGALERPDRTLHPARRRGQHPARQPDDRGAVLPPAPPPGADREAAAPDRVHAEGTPAAARRGVEAQRLHGGHVPVRARRPARHRPRAGDHEARALLGQDLLRHRRPRAARASRERRDRARRAALSVRPRPAPHADRALPEPEADRVGPGGAEEHGRVQRDGPADAGARARGRRLQLHRPAPALEPVRGLPGGPPLRAGADRADRAFVGRRTVVWRSAQQLRLLRRELLLREHAAVA